MHTAHGAWCGLEKGHTLQDETPLRHIEQDAAALEEGGRAYRGGAAVRQGITHSPGQSRIPRAPLRLPDQLARACPALRPKA
jgi:hypothetical protein